MSTLWLALEGAWQVLLVGLLLGAGLPAIFALGIRALAWGSGGAADIELHEPHPLARAIAYALFAVVILAIALGISIVVASGLGMRVEFSGLWPHFVEK